MQGLIKMAIDEEFYYVKVNPRAGRDGVTGTEMKATELKNALISIGLSCMVQKEPRVGRVLCNWSNEHREDGAE